MQFNQAQNPYAVGGGTNADVAAFAEDSERLAFIKRTYAHLTGSIMALIALETVLFMLVPANIMDGLVSRMMGGMGWLVVLGVYMGVSWMARAWAQSSTSTSVQYAGLGLYVVAEAIILLPLLYIAMRFFGPQLPIMAAAITAVCFIGLTVFVFTTRIDLAPWGKYLALAGFVAMGAIVAGILMGFSLGIWFSAFMVGLACAYILYDTSNVLHHYHTSQHVAASLALLSSVVLLFWYILRILMMFASND